MVQYRCSVMGLLLWGLGLCGMNQEAKPLLFSVPVEVVHCKILSSSVCIGEKVYHVKHTSHEALFMPYTLRPINPVSYTNIGDENPHDWEPKEGDNILLDHQLWLSEVIQKCDGRPIGSYIKVRLEHDSADNHDTIKLKKEVGYTAFSFDGINTQRCAVLALSAEAQNGGSFVYFLRQSPHGAGTVEREGMQRKLFSIPGFIQSVMLHPDRNRMFFSYRSKKYSEPSSSYGLHLIDVDDADKDIQVASAKTAFLIDKTIYLGDNRYVGLTVDGKLAHIWLDEKNELLPHTDIRIVKYDNAIKKVVPSDSVIRDIAVDESYQVKKGVRPRIAYVTNKGEVFVMDFFLFKKPTPMFNRIVDNPAEVFRLFYDKGELAVLYRNEKGRYGDFVRWPDNLGLLYLKTVLAQQERFQQNN